MLPFKHAHQLKYRDMMARAMINSLRELGQRGNRKIPDLSSLFPIDMVMPVPLARRRLFKRGYNQAALLARPIARHFNVPVDYDSVRRKYRPDMGHKSYKQRKENIRSVFRVVRPENVRGRVILLADDVMTTGATFSELYKVLKQAGAKAIYGVTFCRVVRAI
jgi:ComF family protein